MRSELDQLVTVLARLSTERRMTHRILQLLLNVRFPQARVLPLGNRSWTVMLANGIWRSTEFREGVADDSCLMNMDIAAAVQIHESDLRGRVPSLPAPVHINPNSGSEVEITFEVNQRIQTTYFGVRYKSRVLPAVSIHRPANGTSTVRDLPWGDGGQSS